MNITEIINGLSGRAGRNVHVEWARPAKKRKAYESLDIQKRVSCAVRGGLDYANLRSVREEIASGERDEVQELPWGEWVQFPIHIAHKGKDYVRFYPPSGGFTGIQAPKVEWLMNGSPVSFAEVAPYLLASEQPDDNNPKCFNVCAEHVTVLR
jgi:hypothetical protein